MAGTLYSHEIAWVRVVSGADTEALEITFSG
jgi:hypothetical protein